MRADADFFHVTQDVRENDVSVFFTCATFHIMVLLSYFDLFGNLQV